MKVFYTIFLLGVLLFSSCAKEDAVVDNTHTNLIIEELEELRLQSKVEFIGVNMINGAQYHVYISCKNGVPTAYRNIPDTQTIQISLLNDCKKYRLSAEMLDEITKKKFYYVYWDMYFQGGENVIYKLTKDEAESIAKAPWEYIAISGFDKDIGKILRDTKNPVRKGYEPTGNPEIYTEEDKKKCDSLWGDGLKEGHEKEWKIQGEKVLECYRNLSVMP